jgi:hypothetical protein
MPAFQDLTGQKFGLLTVEKLDRIDKYAMWRCVCDCGKTTETRTSSLKNGHTKSCGCLALLSGKESYHYKHGKSHLDYHKVWVSMKLRCLNRNHHAFSSYGGRGITVCDRWLDSYDSFIRDMGPRPSHKHSIDRIDVNGNYEPSNCRWATATDQVRNRRILKSNKSGCSGVCFDNKVQKWRTSIRVNKKRIWLGYFDTLHNAIATRWVAEATYWK